MQSHLCMLANKNTFSIFFSQKVRRWVHWTVAEALWTTLERGKPTLFSQRCPFLYFSALLPFLPREGPFQEDLCFPSPPRANRVLQMLSWFTNLRLGLIPIADSCAYLKLARGNSWVLSCSNNAGPYFGKGASFLGNLTLPDYNMLLPRVAGFGRLSAGAKMAMKPFIKRVFTSFATNASFLRVISNFRI